MSQTGRPRGFESRRRTREFLRLLAEGESPLAAAREASVSPSRALRLLDDPGVRAVLVEARRTAA